MALGVLYRLYERNLLGGLDRSQFPQHIGIVLDGHRRHAREEGLSSYTESYRVGMARFEDFLGWANEFDIPAVTAWVLSRENLARPVDELAPYFSVLIELFGRLPQLCSEYDMGIKFIGPTGPVMSVLGDKIAANILACPYNICYLTLV